MGLYWNGVRHYNDPWGWSDPVEDVDTTGNTHYLGTRARRVRPYVPDVPLERWLARDAKREPGAPNRRSRTSHTERKPQHTKEVDMGSYRWERLTRADLSNFDDVATEVILYAMEHGGVGRISRKNHAILRAPDGQRTMSVPWHGARSQQVLETTVRKLFPPKAKPEPPKSAPRPDQPPPHTWQQPILHCPVEGCDATFVTAGAEYDHRHKHHVVCRSPGCQATFKDARAESAHRRIKHEGFKPAAGRTAKRQEVDVPFIEAPMPESRDFPLDVTEPPVTEPGEMPDVLVAAAEQMTRWVREERVVYEERLAACQAATRRAQEAEAALRKRAEDAEAALTQIRKALGQA